MRCMITCVLAGLVGCMLPGRAPADESSQLAKASSSRASKDAAIQGIPFQKLSRPAQQRLMSVIRRPTMYRRMPITMIRCDPELHRFSVRHPEVIVNIWQLMGITQVTAERTAPYVLKCNDGVGTITDIELVYGDRDTHILLCEGSYDGPLFRKPVNGRCVLVLKNGSVATPDGYQLTNRLDIFLQIDHAGLDIFAKTLHPLLGKSADVNFSESMKFVERLSAAAEKNHTGVQHMVGRLENVQPQIRQQFTQVVENVALREQQRSVMASQAKRPKLPTQSSRKG